jgi:hypothetical protein
MFACRLISSLIDQDLRLIHVQGVRLAPPPMIDPIGHPQAFSQHSPSPNRGRCVFSLTTPCATLWSAMGFATDITSVKKSPKLSYAANLHFLVITIVSQKRATQSPVSISDTLIPSHRE